MPSIRSTIRTLAAALTAALLLAAATSSATARNLSLSNENIRVTWRAIEFVSAATVRCRLTLEGRLHARTFIKSRGSLIGAITRIDFDTANCTGGRFRELIETGHLTYEGFTGTLPNINGVILLLSRLLFQIILPGICTASYGIANDNISGLMEITAERLLGRITPIEGRNRITLLSGSGFCPGTSTFRSSSEKPTLLGTTTTIKIALI